MTTTKPPGANRLARESGADMSSSQPLPPENRYTNSSLDGLQTDEQRQILDIVVELRKCGLESILSLPQLVVCGDQSAGKSSVLEAVTEIPFPRSDNLCTRYATEIILRHSAVESLKIKVIPDSQRPSHEQDQIEAFSESITNFDELPSIMAKATVVMGIDNDAAPGRNSSAFTRDVLSVEIEGPRRPQLTLVDIPGLIQNETKGVSKADVELVADITEHYISQPRTICLAVISATNDYANQPILTKVRSVDPDGDRTLGVITKPDRLEPGSGMEQAFIDLARNKDIFLKLGWHVLKNRSFEESANSFEERNLSEASYFRRSNFNVLPLDCVGIESLRDRLSRLLFNHVKQELPKLRQDLETALLDSNAQLGMMGNPRASVQECRDYLAPLSQEFRDICKAAVNGHYEGGYFNSDIDRVFSTSSPTSIRRLRAIIQLVNKEFSDRLRNAGHKYQIIRSDDVSPEKPEAVGISIGGRRRNALKDKSVSPVRMSRDEAVSWIRQALIRTRGKELIGDFNPLLIGELFWEQSSNWRQMSTGHVKRVAELCNQFLQNLLRDKCPKDMYARLWTSQIQDKLHERGEAAMHELELLVEDLKDHPINYNHYYTDTADKQHWEREEKRFSECVEAATRHTKLDGCQSNHTSASIDTKQAIQEYHQPSNPDLEQHACERALDRLFAIYKVMQKTFVANIVTQVVERHIVRGLETIFSPVSVSRMSDAEVAKVVSEPTSVRKQREFLEDRVQKLDRGQKILRGLITDAAL